MKRVSKYLYLLLITTAVMICTLGFSAAQTYAVSETQRANYTIADGVTESVVYVTDRAGVNVRAHILRIQKGADVTLKASTTGYYTAGSTAASRSASAASWSKYDLSTLKDQVAAYNSANETEGTVIAATDGDVCDVDSGSYVPCGNLIIEGNVLNLSSSEAFFAVLKDGSYVIRKGGEDTSDVVEAIGGMTFPNMYMLVDGGRNSVPKSEKWKEPRQGIGVCEDGSVVIINVDGREPRSSGASLYDFAEIFRQQGCVRAINFDGGGSATFLTKRPGDSALVYRNTMGDGFERKLASTLLVVTKANSEAVSGSASVPMTSSKTVLKKSSGVWNYKVNGKKADGFYAINGKCYLFKKGKGLTRTVKVGDTTYKFSKGQLTNKNVVIGYCGSASGGKNLLYAYNYADKTLKVGLNPVTNSKNGKMKNWKGDNNLQLPWYAFRSDIKKVYVGDGVKNLGTKFLYTFDGAVFDGTPVPKSKLTSVRLPDSLTKIGTQALYNKPKLKNLEIPASVTVIERSALGRTGSGYIRFRSYNVPKFGKEAMKDATVKKVYVRNSNAWKKFVKAKKFKKIGYKKAVTYK